MLFGASDGNVIAIAAGSMGRMRLINVTDPKKPYTCSITARSVGGRACRSAAEAAGRFEAAESAGTRYAGRRFGTLGVPGSWFTRSAATISSAAARRAPRGGSAGGGGPPAARAD